VNLESDQIGPAFFATTHWSVIVGAQRRGTAEAEAALEKLCRTYWRPVFAFVRRSAPNEQALASPPTVDFVVVALASSPGMKMLALGMTNGAVEIWDLATRTNILFQAHPAPVLGLAFSPDSRQLVTASENHEVHVWNLATLSRVASARLDEVSTHLSGICVRFSARGDLIAVGSKYQLSIFRGTGRI
jgi:WD40 repeat protein